MLEFKKYILHVKLTVYYTVSFTCNIHFLNSTHFVFNQFKKNKFSCFSCAGYILSNSVSSAYVVWPPGLQVNIVFAYVS